VATHISAIKRAKQNEKRRLRNRHVNSTCRTLVKKVRAAIESNDAAAADLALADAAKALGAAASKGVVHKNNASRRIGRLAAAVAALKKG
jgi:small subunit ribosomal protein S20